MDGGVEGVMDERFVLADDRAAVLEHYVPGSEEAFYHQCLVHQQKGELAKVPPLLEQWRERHGGSSQVEEIERRQALLSYPKEKKKTLEHIRDNTGVSLHHEREVEGEPTHHPTALDSKLLDAARLRKEAIDSSSDLSYLTPHGLEAIATSGQVPDEPERRRALLAKLQRPDVPRLAELVNQDLDHRHSRGFGSLPVHKLMTSTQLDLLEKLRPALKADATFVQCRLVHLQPGPDTAWEHDHEARRAYLDKLVACTAGLAPAFNALKAHALYHRLELDQRLGVSDRERLSAYLQLPRRAGYVEPTWLEKHREHAFNVGSDYRAATLLPTVHDDEPLVRALVGQQLLEKDDARPWNAWIRSHWVDQLLAETQLLAGKGDRDKWAALLDDPSRLAALRDQVELTLVPTNKALWSAAEPVSLQVDVKNIATLVVKVFELNAFNYATTHGKDVDPNIDLDGLAPSSEQVLTYQEAPLRRVRRTIALPALARPGLFVVELIGGGKSSRAFLRKGSLRFVERLTAAGHAFTILDEAGKVLKDATLWLAGKSHAPDQDGEVLIPFATAERQPTIVLRHGDVVSVESFRHRAERYDFGAALHLEREALLGRREATALVRAGLQLHGVAVPLELIEEPTLVLETTDRQGTTSSKRVEGLVLKEDQETTHTFQVPAELARVTLRLEGKVRVVSSGTKQDLADERTFELNQIDGTDKVEALHLARTSDHGWVLHVLGKAGEPRSGAPVRVTLRLREVTRTIDVTLQTDATGRIVLGQLPGVTSVQATRPTGVSDGWSVLPEDRAPLPTVVHAARGEAIRLPWLGAAAGALTHKELSLLERRGPGFLRDALAAASLQDGQLVLKELTPGDYALRLRERGDEVVVRITDGVPAVLDVPGGAWLVGKRRLLERQPRPALQVDGPTVDGETITVRVRGAGKATRVHAFATRFRPAHPAASALEVRGPAGPRSIEAEPTPSTYASGRELGDEVRYVLERKYQKKRPGTLLARPGLLLNPWAMRETDTDQDHVRGGGAYDAREQRGQRREGQAVGKGGGGELQGGTFANLDFLEAGAVVLANLRPDAQGLVKVARSALGNRSQVRFVAVDPVAGVAAREVALPEQAGKHKDVRLRLGLDASAHFTEQRQAAPLLAGEALVVEDVTTAKVEVFDSLGRAFQLLRTLGSHDDLAKFAFVIEWPKLSRAEKCKKLSENGCHELHVFIARKDPAFFEEVVKPHLRNKKDKRFIDRWLLGDDLAAFRKPWAHARLNAAEKCFLAERLAAEAAPTARHLADLLALQPPDPRGDEHRFRTAVAGSALDTDDALGFAQAATMAESSKLDSLRASASFGGDGPGADGAVFASMAVMDMPAPAAPPPPPARRAMAAPSPATGKMMKESAKAKKSARPRDEDGESDDMEMERSADKMAECEEAAPECDAPEPPAEIQDESRSRKDMGRRTELRQLYRAPEVTQELGENDYWHRAVDDQEPDLVPVNAFWRDYARRDPKRPFVSANLPVAASSFTEVMLALAVLDLPFQAARPTVTYEGARMRLVATGPCLVFHQQVRPATPSARPAQLLVSQGLLRPDDRWREEEGQQVEKFVDGELTVHTVYACQVVLTNPTSASYRLELLLQAPVGSVPVSDGFQTRGRTVHLGAFATERVEYAFYFPAPGHFTHFPAHVAKDEALVAAAPHRPLQVVLAPTTVDTTAWAWVSQSAKPDEVLAYLERENVHRLDLSKIAWRMGDKGFFEKALALLERRHAFDETLWGYAVKHDALDPLREWLQHQESFLDDAGPWLESAPVTIDPVVRARYQHKEYAPLLNPRAHRLGDAHRILNERLSEQWKELLETLGRKPRLDAEDWLAVAYYQLLMDRVDEGLLALAKVDGGKVAPRLQLEYLRAYVAMLEGKPGEARALATPFQSYAVDRWRELFRTVVAHVEEAEGKGPATAAASPDEDAGARQARLAASEPLLELSVENRAVTVRYRNVAKAEVSYYLMDVELLFSRQPFAEQRAGSFAFVRPNRTDTVELPAGQSEVLVELPDALRKSNVVVEVVAGGLRRSQPYYAHALDVGLVEAYGQVRVGHQLTHAPLSTVYVKCYARTSGGQVRFHKDGYTDLRGRFDYASVSTSTLDDVERFALLVLSDEHGALVREAAPPPR